MREDQFDEQRKVCFSIASFLSQHECESLIQNAEQQGFSSTDGEVSRLLVNVAWQFYCDPSDL